MVGFLLQGVASVGEGAAWSRGRGDRGAFREADHALAEELISD